MNPRYATIGCMALALIVWTASRIDHSNASSDVGQSTTGRDPISGLSGGILSSPGFTEADQDSLDPRLYLDVGSVSGFVGQLVSIPVYVQTLADSLAGYAVELDLSREDLVYFEVDTVVVGSDTFWVCQFDTAGTLSSGWEYVQARSMEHRGMDLRVTALADIGTGNTPGIGEYTSGVLLRIYGQIRSDVPDTLVNRTVDLVVDDEATYYSNQSGQLIRPAENFDGSVTVPERIPGDVNCDGVLNPMDVVILVNYVYKNWDIICPGSLGDLNCDGAVNPVDVVIITNHVYKNWPIPPC